jgi:hypothetical protein
MLLLGQDAVQVTSATLLGKERPSVHANLPIGMGLLCHPSRGNALVPVAKITKARLFPTLAQNPDLSNSMLLASLKPPHKVSRLAAAKPTMRDVSSALFVWASDSRLISCLVVAIGQRIFN